MITPAKLLRRRAASGQDGFALIYVLFVTTFVLIGTASMLTVATGAIVPARQSQQATGALTAAQSGVQDFVANLNARCRTVSIQSCEWLGDDPVLTDTLGDESYVTRAVNPDNYLSANAGTVRVVSTGTVGSTSRTLTADLSGKPSVLRFAYFSNYETLGKSFLDYYYGPRTIRITNTDALGFLGLNKVTGATVQWKGAGTAPTNGYTDNVCDSVYYGTQGRSSVTAVRANLPIGADFSESGTYTAGLVSGSSAVNRDAACQVAFTGRTDTSGTPTDSRTNPTFNGPVYSRDAIMLSNGAYGSTGSPFFAVPAGETLPALSTGRAITDAPATTADKLYTVDPGVSGAAQIYKGAAAQQVQTFPLQLSLPTTATPKATCTYTGPTRIVLSGGTAYVSSPLSTGTGACFTTGTSGAYEVPVRRTTIRVVDAASGSGLTFPSVGNLAAALNVGSGNDITTYSPTAGDAYVQGNLTSGRLSIVTSGDIVATGSVTTTATTGANGLGEPAWTSGGAIALVATKNVRVYHPVRCKTGSATDGYCTNDISGLYSTTESSAVANTDGTLKDTHPSAQYVNLTTPGNIRLDAAVMALNGSLYTDNFNRGSALGVVTVNGGVYQNHRGALGQLWEVPDRAVSGVRPMSGYKLSVSYVSYTNAGLPYVPVLDTDAAANPLTPWFVVGVSTGGTQR